MSLVVTQLLVYPIKGCRGVSVARSEVTDAGLRYDREFMVVESDGAFITQRTHSKLALMVPHLAADALKSEALSVSAPGMPVLQVPLTPRPRRRRCVSVWEWSGEADDEGDEAADWVSRFMGVQGLRLVRFAQDALRETDRTYAGKEGTNPTLFSDGYPVLTASEASLADLNSRLDTPLSMDRFRPNLVVGGARPFEEDTWERYSVGSVRLRGVKPCSRCKVTTINQATGEAAGLEPLRSMAAFRSGNALGWRAPDGESWRGQAFFGFNACLEGERGGVMAVGDAVHVHSTRDWRDVVPA